ncbi:MAG: ABC transporter substrate-binding protein [Hahellaceae bacterium]|nr:ABC transporter substrate-binding protein [Hahellaceae bacterium]
MRLSSRLRVVLVTLMVSGVSFQVPAAEPSTLNYLMVDSKSRPFQIEDGEFEGGDGIITDIVYALVSNSPEFRIESNSYPVLRVQNMIQTGKVKNWIVYNAKVWNTFAKEGRFLDVPLFEVTHSLATCSDVLTEITSGDALKGHTLAILNGFDYPELVPLEDEGGLKLLPVDTYRPGFELVTRQRVTGFVEMDLRLKYNASQAKIQAACLRYLDLSRVIPPFSIYLEVDRNMPEDVVGRLESRLKQMKAEGEIVRIVDRYIKP